MGKVHESCEKLESHLTKLGNSLNGTLPAVGYLQLSEKVQGEGLKQGVRRKDEGKGRALVEGDWKDSGCLFNKKGQRTCRGT